MRRGAIKGSILTGTERRRKTVFFFTALFFSLYLAAPACAGMVWGMARNDRGPLPGIRMELKDSRGKRYMTMTDGSGRYKVNLPPGLYKATIPGNRRVLILPSSPQPSRQDLNFGR